MNVVGKLRKNSIGRWEIVDSDDRRVEITSGDVIEVLIGATWFTTRVESRSAPVAPFEAQYYAVYPGIQLYAGMPARIQY